MMKRFLMAGAAVLALTQAAPAAAPVFSPGWNRVVLTNCLDILGDYTVNPAIPTQQVFFVEIIDPGPPVVPPPIPKATSFTTIDPVVIANGVHFCATGDEFFLYWDSVKGKVTYASIYPNLGP